MKGHSYNPDGCPKCGKVHTPTSRMHAMGCMCSVCRLGRGEAFGETSPRFGKLLSDTHKQKLSQKIKGRPNLKNRGRVMSVESNRRRSQALKGRSKSSEHKQRIGQSNSGKMRVLWQDPSYVAKQMAARNVSQNKAEKYLQQILDAHFPGEWKFVGDGQLIVAGKCPDFVHTERKLLIELFGDYWHSQGITGVPKEQHERERIQLFESEGYQTLVVWEHELTALELMVAVIRVFQRRVPWHRQ